MSCRENTIDFILISSCPQTHEFKQVWFYNTHFEYKSVRVRLNWEYVSKKVRNNISIYVSFTQIQNGSVVSCHFVLAVVHTIFSLLMRISVQQYMYTY